MTDVSLPGVLPEDGHTTDVPVRPVSLISALLHHRGSLIGLAILGAIALAAAAAPVIAPFDPFSLHQPLQPPSATHWLGTDSLGHDVLSFLIWGGRVSIAFAIGASVISLLVGVVVGAIPSYYGGTFDDAVSRVVETFLMIPQLFLIITVVALLGANAIFVIVVIGATIWPSNAKLMGAQVLTLKSRPFVEASVIAGERPFLVLLRHVIPNGIGPVVANSTLQMALAVLTEAGLSFLGLSDPNQASWGRLLNDGQSYITSAWWLVITPGVALFLLLVALHLVGDGVAEMLDPRRRGLIDVGA